MKVTVVTKDDSFHYTDAVVEFAVVGDDGVLAIVDPRSKELIRGWTCKQAVEQDLQLRVDRTDGRWSDGN